MVEKKAEEALQACKEIPLQLMVKTILKQVMSLRPMEDSKPEQLAGGHTLKNAAVHSIIGLF